jgi:hypothetical protein
MRRGCTRMLYLAQPVLANAIWGVAYLVSARLRRPLVGVFANAWYPFPPDFRASRAYKDVFCFESVVWGLYLLARSGLRLGFLLAGGIGAFVLVVAVTGPPVFLALIAWSVWYARRRFTTNSSSYAAPALS